MVIGTTEIRPATPGTTGALPALLAGKVIEARLVLALGGGMFRFASGEGELDLPLPRALPLGTQVRITAQPDGSFQLTVVEEGGLPAPARPGPPASAPPLNISVRPQTPLPPLPPGQPVEARVIASPRPGTVRVATPEGEVELALPRALPPGTSIRITPQPDGTLDVAMPRVAASQAAPAAATPRAPSSPQPVVPSPANGAAVPQSAFQSMSVHPAPTAMRPQPAIVTIRPPVLPPQIPVGQVIEARIVSLPDAATARFAGPAGEFDLPAAPAFMPGAQVRIAAQPNGQVVVTIRTDIHSEEISVRAPMTVPSPAASIAPAAAPPTAPRTIPPLPPGSIPILAQMSPPAPMPAQPLPQPVLIPSTPGLPVFPLNEMVEAHVQMPLANGTVRFTSATAGEFDLPLPHPLPAGAPVRIIQQPNGAITLTPLADAPDTPAPPRPEAPAAPSPVLAARIASRGTVARQDSLAPLFADIADLPYRLTAPVPVRHAAERLLDSRLLLDFVTRPHQLAKAIASSGIFAERMLSTLPANRTAPPDIKLALYVLRAALGQWSSVRTEPQTHPENRILPPAPGMPPAAQPPSEPANIRGVAQAPAMHEPAEKMVPRLIGETDAAIARISLHQMASLPDDRAAPQADIPDARWSCEIPVNVDGRTAMFGFIVERDGRHASHEREKRKWRVRAALDLQETGAVEADVRLHGDAVAANIIAERQETAVLLETALPMLRDGLMVAGFEIESLSVRLGKSAPEAVMPRHFVDRRT